jgi:murein L,D-transpeptidase YcbB/YkuD
MTAPVTAALAQDAGDPVALAVKAQAGGKLKDVYVARGYWPLWVREGALTPAADRLIGYLETAGLDGLDPRDFDVEELTQSVEAARGGAPDALARAELRLSAALARYVRDVRRAPTIQFRFLDEELRPKRLSEAEVFRAAAVAPDFTRDVETKGWLNPA